MTIKTPAQLIAEINSLFADNTTGLITPAFLRTVTTDMVNSLAALIPPTTKLIAAGPYAALPSDQILLVNQIAGAAMTITVDWSARTQPLRIVDAKGDANVNNITITPASGQTQFTVVNYSYKINTVGGSITLTPLPDGSGAY